MKKVILVLLAIFVLASVSLALSDKYQIFSEKKGWFGLGGRTIMMLDRESGDCWRYTGEKWVAIPKVTEEVTVKAVAVEENVVKESEADKKARIEAEVNALKVKQEADLKAMQAKQLDEVNSLVDKLSVEKKNSAVEENKPEIARPIRPNRPKAAAVVKKPAESNSEDENNSPPSWLTD